MNEPDEAQPRVNCPRCGKRFRVDLERVQSSPSGASVRCSGCRTTFRLTLQDDGSLSVSEGGESPPRRAPPSSKGHPASERRRKGRTRRMPPRRAREGGTPGADAAPEEAVDLGLGIGERIGRYEVEALLGRGGMAAVYRAFDPAANRHVALKVLSADAPPDDQARFQREVQVQGNIQHPHIMHIYDSGVVGGARHFAMELLKDPISLTDLGAMALDGRAARDPHLRPAATLEGIVRTIVLPVCEAIHHANVREGVIHRDLKPDNVLIDRNGLRPFVIDFGICSIIERKNQRLAHLPKETPGRLAGGGVRVTGTLVYMPPEQARGVVDRRGDVWALGALLHYLLTGAAPLAAASSATVSADQRIEGLKLLIEQAHREGAGADEAAFRQKLRDVEGGRERTLEDLQRDVLAAQYLPLPARTPARLAAIVRKAMAREPEDRYRHALDLKNDLDAWLEGRTVRAQIEQANPLLRPVHRGRALLRRHGWALLFLLLAGWASAWALFGGQGREGEGHDAADRIEAAEKALAEGRTADARTALLQAIGGDPTTRRARDMLAAIDQEAALTEAVRRGEALAANMQSAFDAGDEAGGLAALAGLREVVTWRVVPFLGSGTPDSLRQGAFRLQALATGTRAIRPSLAVDRVEATPLDPASHVARFERTVVLKDVGGRLAFGSWLLRVVHGDGVLWLPVDVPPGTEAIDLAVPVDPARIPEGLVYVPAGRSRGPDGASDVEALLWDATEVSAARYARFLASLAPAERRRRMPRETTSPDAGPRPLWRLDGDEVVPPQNAASLPVEGISHQDASAFAAFEGARLPTAAEWCFAAVGAGRRSTPLGSLEAVLASDLNVGSRHASVLASGSLPADRSLFGLLDMTGNVAELTSTLATERGRNGWLVMGGSYLASPAAALVTAAETVPGLEARRGVGVRLVRGLEALKPAPGGSDED